MASMSTGAISRYAAAWQRGDLSALLDAYAPDVVTHYGGTSAFAGTHVGRDRLVEILVETTTRSARRLIAIDAVYDEDTHGAIFVREAITVDGAEHVVERCLRYRVEADLLCEIWLYDRDQHLVDRAWGAPAEH